MSAKQQDNMRCMSCFQVNIEKCMFREMSCLIILRTKVYVYEILINSIMDFLNGMIRFCFFSGSYPIRVRSDQNILHQNDRLLQEEVSAIRESGKSGYYLLKNY